MSEDHTTPELDLVDIVNAILSNKVTDKSITTMLITIYQEATKLADRYYDVTGKRVHISSKTFFKQGVQAFMDAYLQKQKQYDEETELLHDFERCLDEFTLEYDNY